MVAVVSFGLGLLFGIGRIVGGDLWFVVPTAVTTLLAFWVCAQSLRETEGMPTFSHIGHCVADLDLAVRFYVELLGFEPYADLRPPDASSAQLMRLGTPLGLHAVYLRRDGLLLELLHYEDLGARPARERPLDEPGLTHLSLWCDDPETHRALLDRVPEYGGEVLADTDLGVACMIRDPDGQLIELLGRPFDPARW